MHRFETVAELKSNIHALLRLSIMPCEMPAMAPESPHIQPNIQSNIPRIPLDICWHIAKFIVAEYKVNQAIYINARKGYSCARANQRRLSIYLREANIRCCRSGMYNSPAVNASYRTIHELKTVQAAKYKMTARIHWASLSQEQRFDIMLDHRKSRMIEFHRRQAIAARRRQIKDSRSKRKAIRRVLRMSFM